MTWSSFYLVCFVIGFGLSALSLLAGSAHLHVPHLHFHHGVPSAHGQGVSFFNVGTMAIFLAWFGGTGYLLEHYYHVWFPVVLAISIFTGLGGGALVFWFLAKFLVGHEKPLDPADYDMIGVLGKLSVPIRSNGTGELIYSQQGTRRVTGARAEDGAAMPKGCEVIVTRFDKGIAYVRRWVDPAGEL